MTILLFICLHAFWPKGNQRGNRGKNYTVQEKRMLKTSNAKRSPPKIEVATVSCEDVRKIFRKSSTKQCYRRFKFCITVHYVCIVFQVFYIEFRCGGNYILSLLSLDSVDKR